MQTLKLGDPQSLETDIGPIIDAHITKMKAARWSFYTKAPVGNTEPLTLD
ncbi:MAG: hypothetical protein ABJG88_02390 [Litorimonas sp.]